ncbi:MAG TPA: hypothetical protein VLF95_11045, partial [Vicinamibacteria bacterium]|nr:hypothetical protein [Vicinamibacteria bacterium]
GPGEKGLVPDRHPRTRGRRCPRRTAGECGEPDAETRSEVPALADLHEAIFPLWHEAWPSKDYEKMKALLPQLRAGVAKVAEARLPGILRDKQGLLR